MYKGYHDAIRGTWVKECPIEYKFVLGSNVLGSNVIGGHRPLCLSSDTIIMDVPDDKDHLSHKILAAVKWAKKEKYGHILVVWNDTYVSHKRIMESGYEKWDYSGHFRGEECKQGEKVNLGCYASGGSGYWLSPYASDFVVQEDKPDHWADDLWVGRVMKKAGIRGTQDYRFFSSGGYDPTCVTVHLSRGSGIYTPVWMWQTHREATRRNEL